MSCLRPASMTGSPCRSSVPGRLRLRVYASTQAQMPQPRRDPARPPYSVDQGPQMQQPYARGHPGFDQRFNPGASGQWAQLPPNGSGVPPPPPPPPQRPEDPKPSRSQLRSWTNAWVAAAFIMGLGMGVYFDAEVVLTPSNVSSTEIIDRNTPNPEVCLANGYSASVFDMTLYVTYNPFNVYVAQPVVKSGCVLRRANVGLLEREQLVTPHEVDLCKSRMNTFAYTGDLNNQPSVSCVYHSEEAENQYLMARNILGGSSAAAAAATTTSSGAAGQAAGTGAAAAQP